MNKKFLKKITLLTLILVLVFQLIQVPTTTLAFTDTDTSQLNQQDKPTGYAAAEGTGSGGGVDKTESLVRIFKKSVSGGGTAVIADYYFYNSLAACKFADSITVSNKEAAAQFAISGLVGTFNGPGGLIVGALYLINSINRSSLAAKIKNTAYKNSRIHVRVQVVKSTSTTSSTTVKAWDGKTITSISGMKLVSSIYR